MAHEYHLIDSHTHVQFSAYDADRAEVIGRAHGAGVGIINVGTEYVTSKDAIGIAEGYPDGVWASVGFHPNHTHTNSYHDTEELRDPGVERFNIEKFRPFVMHPKVVAIGECGLDYYRIKDSVSIREEQHRVFRQQIELARDAGLPLVIHCRQAFDDLITILTTYHQGQSEGSNGVVHFFSGSWADAERLLDLGFMLGFGGVVTFAREYDEVVRKIPLDRLLVETDAPYVAPVPYRGKRNEPACITETIKKISELRSVSYEVLAGATTANAERLFRFSARASLRD